MFLLFFLFSLIKQERRARSTHEPPLVTFPVCPYLLHVEPHVQYLKMKFCSFGSRYAGTGQRREKTPAGKPGEELRAQKNILKAAGNLQKSDFFKKKMHHVTPEVQ